VISGCDASTNQINAPGSAFYDADLRDVEEPFRNAYVEVGKRGHILFSSITGDTID